MSRVLFIPDLHEPFAHQDAYNFLSEVASKYKTNLVICAGDEVDFHAMSPKYISDPNGMSPSDELEACRKGLAKFYKLFPKTRVCHSNHTSRPFRAAKEYGIPEIFIRSYHEFFEAPSTWQWADNYIIDEVMYEHGEGVSGANGHIKAAVTNQMSTAIGHIHSFAGVNYMKNGAGKMIFALNSGCLINNKAYAFAYGKAIRYKPILGASVILDAVPHFIPMILKPNERWIGKIAA